jgi:hypothetical protein
MIPNDVTEPSMLIQLANSRAYKISNKSIMEQRESLREEVLDEIQQYQQELNVNINSKINRVKFLNKFYLYSGLAKQKSDKDKTFDITKAEAVEALTCDHKWPVCLFDFTYKNKVPEFFVFKTERSTYKLDFGYFYGDQAKPGTPPLLSNGCGEYPQASFHNNHTHLQPSKVEEEASDQDMISPAKSRADAPGE